jgi:hypothetical protein
MARAREDLVFSLNVRVYGAIQHSKLSHSYLIDDMPTGVSHVVGVLQINIRHFNLKQVRLMIEYDKSNHMDRRSMLFQEAMFIMNRLPNLAQIPSDQRYSYRMGFLRKDRSELKVIAEEDEEKLISDLLGPVDFFDYDLAIVPLSQIAS